MCLLDLQSSTRPHMVANITVSDSKILCISSVPLWDVLEDNEDERSHSVMESDDLVGIRDIPLDNRDGLEDGLHPGMGSKTTQSMPRDLRGSLVASFSSDSGSTSRSISRTPSVSSTRSEPRTDTPTLPSNIVGIASDILDTDSTPIRFRGHDNETTVGSGRKRNGFHRVCSNSAPDLLKVVSESSAMEGGFRKREECGATSLSPPPPVDSKLWSPLTLVEEDKQEDKGTSMWLGTEEGQILVYSAGSNLRSRSNRCTIHLPAAVHCIRYVHLFP